MLGPAGNVEFVPLFVPVKTYQIVLDKAKVLGCTAAEVFERAVYEYLRTAEAPREEEPKAVVHPGLPVISVKRRR